MPNEEIPESELFALDNALAELSAACRNAKPLQEPVLQLARRAEQIRDALGSLEAPGHVSWSLGEGRSRSVGSSPIDIGPLLRERLHERVPCVVYTSATLTTGGDFKFAKRRLGIDAEVSEEIVESPFRYERQAALYAPTHLPDPRASDFPDAATKEILELIRNTKHARIPLYEKTLDEIVGYLPTKNFLLDPSTRLTKLLRPVLVVPEKAPVDRVFQDLRKGRWRMAVVVNEYGETVGLFTQEDLIEEIVGELADEYERVEEEIVRIGDEIYEVRGQASIQDLSAALEIDHSSLGVALPHLAHTGRQAVPR